MTQSSRTFRIFVSSTFSDLKAERNALQEKVFPRLRELAMAHGYRFQAIDLRWGVSEEAALDQQTMKICLGEIARCQKTSPRPNFLILLGDRYGWRPLPYEIPAGEFEQIQSLLAQDDRTLLEKWYQRDDNALPAMYCLLPRSGEFVEYLAWEQVENQLRRAFVTATQQLALSPDAMRKYTASATEQEIAVGAMQVPDAREHIFGFFREIEGLPADESSQDYRDADSEAFQKQTELKRCLRQQLLKNIHDYKVTWQGKNPSLDHLDRFCEEVYTDLSKVILTEAGRLEALDPLDKEINAHEDFGKERVGGFIGREDILKVIADYIKKDDPHPLAVWGSSGSGKSALMAKAVEQAQEYNQEIIYRFIGATPESSNGRFLLESLCRQITRAYHGDESTIPSAYNELVREFPERLALASSGKPLLLFVDALDQLSDADAARSLAWLPTVLPSFVKLIVSSLPSECLEVLEKHLPVSSLLTVPGMEKTVGQNLLQRWLDQANRSLTEEQHWDILDKFATGGGLPLYLKLAFEEARHWHSFDGLPALSNSEPGLSKDILGIIRDLFWRLEQKNNHGQILVSHALGYMAAAKNGLSEDELLDVLWLDEEVKTDFFARSPRSPREISGLPVVIWARLFLDLEPYLSFRKADGAELMTFYHRQVTEVAQEAYLQKERYAGLAAYFESKPLYLQEQDQTPNLRKLSESVHQLAGGQLWSDLKNTLTDFHFMEARCRAFSIYDLEKDFQTGLEHWMGERMDQEVLNIFEERLRLESHAVNKAPELLFPNLYNHLTWLDAPDGPIHTLCERAVEDHDNWLRMTQDPRPAPPPWLRSLEGHTDYVESVVLTPDAQQVVSGSADGTVRVWDLASGALLRTMGSRTGRITCVVVTPDGKQIVSGSWDKTIQIWDLASGQLLRSVEGHQDRVTCVTCTPDGLQVISGSEDQSVKIWDLKSGKLLRSLEGHTKIVKCVAVTSDGQHVVSGSVDKTIKVWELASGRLLRTLEGHNEIVNSVSISPDGQYVVSGSGRFLSSYPDDTIKVWDLVSGRLVRILEGHLKWVGSVTITPDGKQIISGSGDDTIKVWDLASGQFLRSLEGHTNSVNSIVITSDGQQVISGSNDKTIKVWDLTSGRLLRSMEGHTEAVIVTAVTPDGQKVISGSQDKTLKVWNLESGLLLRSLHLHGHTDTVLSVAVTMDGQQVITGSNDNTIKVWDLASGQQLQSLEGHSLGVCALVVTPDGRQLVSGSFDKTIKVWELTSGRLLRSLEGHTNYVTSLAVAPNGKQVVSGSEDKTVKIWDLASGRMLRSLEDHTLRVNSIAITPDGQQVVSGSWDCWIKVWNLASGKLLRSIEGHNFGVYALAVTPDGQQVVSGSGDGAVKVCDLASGRLLRILGSHTDKVNSVAVTPDGRRVVSGSKDSTIKIWDPAKGYLAGSLSGHLEMVTTVAVTPDGQQVLSGSKDKKIKNWDSKNGRLHCILAGHADWLYSLSVTPDGQRAVSGSLDKTIKVWELGTGSLISSLEGHTSSVYSVDITPDGSKVVSGSYDNTIKVWDLENGRLLRTLEGHSLGVSSVNVTPDGQQIVSISSDKTIRVWDLASGQCLRSMDSNTGTGTAIAQTAMSISPDGQFLVTTEQRLIKVWNLVSGRLLRSFKGHTGFVNSALITPDGREVVSGSSDNTARIWDIESGSSKVLFVNDNRILCLALSQSGSIVALGDGLGRVWIFEWKRKDPIVPVLTAKKNKGLLVWKKPYVFSCHHCHTLIEISKSDLGIILSCPRCGKKVRLNRFII